MSRKDVTGKIKLNRFDELFDAGAAEMVNEGDSEIKEIPLSELHEFKNHPFKVRSDGELAEMIESVRQHGVLVPGIARTRPEGGYEIIAGHTRRHICEIVGLKTMPMFVWYYVKKKYKLKVNFSYNIPFPSSYQSFHLF